MTEPVFLPAERLRRMAEQPESPAAHLRNALQILSGCRVRCRLYDLAVPTEEGLMTDVLEFVTATEARIEKALELLEGR